MGEFEGPVAVQSARLTRYVIFTRRVFRFWAQRFLSPGETRETRRISPSGALKISERVAIGLAVEAELGKRQGQRTDLASELRHDGDEVTGRTDAIAAEKAGLR